MVVGAVSLRFDGLTYRYPGSEHDALADVSVEWTGPGLRIVTGRLGSGCSTFLLLATGLAPRILSGTRRGEVHVHGVDPATSAGARDLVGRIGLLLPTPWTQLSGMTYRVADEIAFGPANLGWPAARIRTSVDRTMDLLHLGPLAARDPVTLSGGELLRVILAGLLAMEPDVLLLDEPATELDPTEAERVYALLGDLADRVSVVVATSDLDRVASRADAVVVLDGGRVLTVGEPAFALRHPAAVDLGVTTTIGEVMRGAGAETLPLDVESAVRHLSGP